LEIPKEFRLAKRDKTPTFSWPRVNEKKSTESRRMLALMGSRKSAETDLQKIANRIQRLHQQVRRTRNERDTTTATTMCKNHLETPETRRTHIATLCTAFLSRVLGSPHSLITLWGRKTTNQ
jgi:hypothetical protein